LAVSAPFGDSHQQRNIITMTKTTEAVKPDCCAALRDLAAAVERYVAAGHLTRTNGSNTEASDMIEAMHRAGQVLAAQ
jgi:hypothetical protein